jgi:squalene-associated FAD-dependent desaturase
MSARGSNAERFDIVIVGGGLAGLAAAVECASRGGSVALLEQAPKLGGRCYSYIDETTGDTVDNGQHILLGAYRATLRYLSVIGSEQLLRNIPRLRFPFVHPFKGAVVFEVAALPKPLHVPAGMLRYTHLSLTDRRKLLRVGLELARWTKRLEARLSTLTVDDWLTRLGQSDDAKQCLWNPIAVSVMNEAPERASALLFARSLKLAFFGTKSDAAVLIPTVGQTELYVRGASEFLARHECRIETQTAVRSINILGNRATGVTLTDGRSILSDKVISAVPHFACAGLLPQQFRTTAPFSHFHRFRSSPIVSIHLWFDQLQVDFDYAGVIGGTIQWIFNRRRLLTESPKHTAYLSAVISGAHTVVDSPKEELLALALQDVGRIVPEANHRRLLHSVIIKEKRATFSPTIESETIRPSTETPIQHFYLAGDWTNTGLPATIEGAIQSGFSAARCAMSTSKLQ